VERVLLAWVGLRGAVPVVLATFPVIAGVPGSLEFFNIVFFAVMVSLLVQGPTIEALARRLGLTTSDAAPLSLVELDLIRRLGADVIEYVVGALDAVAGAPVRDLGLPREAVVSVIVRAGEAITARLDAPASGRPPAQTTGPGSRPRNGRRRPSQVFRWGSAPMGTPARGGQHRRRCSCPPASSRERSC
jgi:cell volume regulation protein A